jgi:DNA-directed RNA polymerase subunit N (RpoN/RPB10)
MNFDLDFMDITGDRLSEMRLLVEGAITLFEDEASVLCHLARDAEEDDARSAFNDIGAALYCMRRHVIHLQTAHHKEATRNGEPNA